MVTFVRYPGRTADERGPRGERFLDNARCEGRLPDIVTEVLYRITTNMRQTTLVEGLFHRTLPEYPVEAIREALVNAVAHRDYSPMGRGSPVRVEMFSDRLVVQSPGGLYGSVNEHNIEQAQSTRNQLLMRFLEDLRLVGIRGSGIRAMIAAMREARLEPPQLSDTRNHFQVVFRNTSWMDAEGLRWLSQFGGHHLNDNQRTALLYLRNNQRMVTSDYRRLNNLSDTVQATRELRELVESGLVTMHSTRRWASYSLTGAPIRVSVQAQLGVEDEKILEYVRLEGAITRGACAALLGETPRRASYLLARLTDRGYLRAIGRKRGTRHVADTRLVAGK